MRVRRRRVVVAMAEGVRGVAAGGSNVGQRV